MRHKTKIDSGGPRIIIFDDIFPNPISGFRVAEYNFYFDIFPNLSILCSTPFYNDYKIAYNKIHSEYAGRYRFFSGEPQDQIDLCYVNFLNNAYAYLPFIESAAAPFVFTLYPGGGFNLGDRVATEKLKKVLGTPLLRGVISTQRITSTVLRELDCPVPIHEIYGATINPIYTSSAADHFIMARQGDELAICFAAFNYGDHGRSKGYQAFIAAAELVASCSANTRFSVVGNFSSEDFPLSPHLKSRLHFHGPLSTQLLRSFFMAQDVIISPNAPYSAGNGEFDGFPTATCVEASLCGVAMICTDELNLNVHYASDEIIVCETDAESILRAIKPYIACPEKLRLVGEHGRAKSLRLFSPAAQLSPRAQVLRQAATNRGRPAGRRYGSAERYISAS